MTSSNKLNLKDYVKTDPSQKLQNNLTQQTHRFEDKPLKNQRKPTNRQSKKLKLNTLPCQQIEKDGNQKFLFRSTWQDDMEQLKQEMKGCTSPTFATEILSHANNYSTLFPFTDQINEQQDDSSKRTRISNSRSKSKKNKSLQKFIGDSVSTHRPSNSTGERASVQMGHQSQVTISHSQQEMYLYELNKLESVTHEMRRQNQKLEEKCKKFKEKCQQLEDQVCQNPGLNADNLMTNEILLQKMKNESFWKFYMKAEKMIKASMAQNNQQSFASPINFMKELEALREMSSEMKKDNKSLKKMGEERGEQVEKMKDKLNVQEAQVEEMRLKCVAYESSIKRLREQLSKNTKQLQKLSSMKEIQQRLNQKSHQASTLSKQVSTLTFQLQQQKLLNGECQKQRLSTKKKCQQLNEQIISLNNQLSSIKTSYNLMEIQKQELSANKKELIEKERLKEKVFQLEKEMKSVMLVKEQEISKLRAECETMFGKEIEVKDSRVKELDLKVEHILGNITELQTQNGMYIEENKQLSKQNSQLSKDNNKLTNENKGLSKQVNQLNDKNSHLSQQLNSTRQQNESRLNEFSRQLQTLTSKLDEQSMSLLTQQKLIQELKKQVNQKQELLKVKQFESEKLKASLGIIVEEQDQTRLNNVKISKKNKRGQSQTNLAQLQEQNIKLQQKLNQALELYQQVHNQKVQLQLQLQYCQQQIQALTNQLQQKLPYPSQSRQNPTLNNNKLSPTPSEDTLQMIENLLTIKEEIIKKILVFCPQDYKSLLVQYIYFGDMIKEKYFEIINYRLTQEETYDRQNHYEQQGQQHQGEQDQSYLQVQDENSNFYHQGQTTRNNFNMQENSRYNRTKPYQSRNPQYENSSSQPNDSQPEQPSNDIHSQQQEINYLVEEFVKIGKIIDQQTKQNYLHHQKLHSKDRKKNLEKQQLHLSKEKQRQREEEFRRSKEKQIQQSKNLLNQLNKKIQKVKENNINDQNSFHYQLASNQLASNQFDKKIPSKVNKNFTQDHKYPSEPIQRTNRQPLQTNENRVQENISRPLFTGKDIKIKNPHMMRNPYQQEQRQQRPYEEQNSVQRSSMMPIQQTPYQKGSQSQQAVSSRNNFNHGALNKLNMLKISDRIRQ